MAASAPQLHYQGCYTVQVLISVGESWHVERSCGLHSTQTKGCRQVFLASYAAVRSHQVRGQIQVSKAVVHPDKRTKQWFYVNFDHSFPRRPWYARLGRGHRCRKKSQHQLITTAMLSFSPTHPSPSRPPPLPAKRPTCGLEGLRDHVVDEAVGVSDPSCLELLLVFVLVDLLEDVLESTVVGLPRQAQRRRGGERGRGRWRVRMFTRQ